METNTSTFAGPVTLLKSAWSTYKPNWKILTPIAITPSIFMMLGTLIGGAGIVFMVIGTIITIAGAVFAVAMAPALIVTLKKLDDGVAASTIKYWPQYRAGFKFFWIVLGLGILQGAITLGAGVLFFIPAIIVGVFISFYLFIRILEGNKGFSAYTESYSLVSGRWWKVFGRMVFFFLIYIAAVIVIGLIGLLVATIFGRESVLTTVIAMVLQLGLMAVVGPLALVYIYKLYNALRSTRTANVETGTFKKWLVAFLVIGIIAAILLPLTGALTAFTVLSRGGQGRFYNLGSGNYPGIDRGNYDLQMNEALNRMKALSNATSTDR